ncbi:MAG: RagB/SusD family nutrient uptake outer membrane protein, partial [Sphingobacteriales bacterium]
VEQERRIELFTEWGDRWIYLRHKGKLDVVLSAIKPNWKSTAAFYPLPHAELQLNPNLKQNLGY